MISLLEEERAAKMRQARDAKATMVRAVSIGLCILFLLGGVLCSVLYGWASYRIGKLGLESERLPLEGTLSVRGIRTISTGMAMTRAAMARELDDSGLSVASSGEEKADTYSLVGDNILQLHAELGLVRVHFRGGKIDRMQNEKNEDFDALQIPSAVLFWMHDKKEDLRWLFSQRQIFADDEELGGSVLPSVLISSEDRAFFTHGGVAPRSIAAAAFDTFRGARMRGAGTITEQLGRTLIWPDEDPGRQSRLHKYSRKFLEFFLASALERRLTKEQILRTYVNAVDAGTVETASGQRHQVRGLKALAFYEFGVRDLRVLTLAQAAALVSVLPKPNYYVAHPDQLRRRRDEVVLKAVANLHPEQAAAVRAAMKEPLGFVHVMADGEANAKESYGFFLDSWRASPDFQSEAREAESLSLSVDPVLQDAAAAALRNEIVELRRWNLPHVEGAIVALDPESGKILALVGGDQFPELDAVRQYYRTGSTVKPFYGARALEEGSVSGEPLTAVTPLNLADCGIGAWQPNDGESGGYLSTRVALARSSDCGAVAVSKSLGLQKACDAIGLALQNDPICSGPALLGGAQGSEASPLHMAEGYAAFANGGKRVEAEFMQYKRPRRPSTRLFSPQAAFVEMQMMQSVMRQGTGAQALAWSGLPKGAALAGKTGTDSAGDFWIAVVQPRLIVVVMISAGSDKALTEQAGYTGGLIAGKIWAAFVRRSFQVAPYYFGGEFQQPFGVESLEVDRSRGCLLPGTKDYEIFLLDRVPPACS